MAENAELTQLLTGKEAKLTRAKETIKSDLELQIQMRQQVYTLLSNLYESRFLCLHRRLSHCRPKIWS